ncbi:MAG: PilZ domain-containing protein [Dissulfurispiraceae bacterium]|jgi:c-di-GMP-binding flagellar brake protein YcgR
MVVEPKDISNKRRKIKNKREYFRLTERIRINVQRIEKPGEEQFTDDPIVERVGKIYEFYTQDISAGGLQFYSEVFYRENSYLEITLNFKVTDPPFEPVTVKATVRRAEQIENSRYYNVSVMFVDINQKDRSHIERYIFLRQREMIAEKRIGYL